MDLARPAGLAPVRAADFRGRLDEVSISPFDDPTGTDRVAISARESARADALITQIDALDELDLEGLRAHWRRRYGEAPILRSPKLLRLMLAWRLQAATWGGLEGDVRRRLRSPVTGQPSDLNLPVGARIAREWKGETQEVEVTADGFVWRGRKFQSLSAVARAITGTRWNGPRFFGLRAGRP